ncbi:hypothetical protein [Bathymodiolus japonicus methanotrophic gill symbiont]|nr:hypothetical protein [Bathymodiolus japonicus methanotrophic gill symbiont]
MPKTSFRKNSDSPIIAPILVRVLVLSQALKIRETEPKRSDDF